jgi:hypothetical protein
MTFGTRSFYSPLRVRTLWAAAWGTSLMFSMAAPDARAAGVIAECSESQLVAAVHGGGAVQFACSGTVVVTSTLHIRSNTSISGAGFIVTLSGGGSVPVLQVEAKTTLTLSSLTIASGYNQTGGGGVDNTGTLNIPIPRSPQTAAHRDKVGPSTTMVLYASPTAPLPATRLTAARGVQFTTLRQARWLFKTARF